MANEYFTFERLIGNEKVQKWINYASKQKNVKFAMKKYKR
jgi:hypothetical protein